MNNERGFDHSNHTLIASEIDPSGKVVETPLSPGDLVQPLVVRWSQSPHASDSMFLFIVCSFSWSFDL
jgi:hypothetical protein